LWKNSKGWLSSVLAEILEEDEGLVAKEDISPELKRKPWRICRKF